MPKALPDQAYIARMSRDLGKATYDALKELRNLLKAGRPRKNPSRKPKNPGGREDLKKWDYPPPADAKEALAYAKLRLAAIDQILMLRFGSQRREGLTATQRDKEIEYLVRVARMPKESQEKTARQWVDEGRCSRDHADLILKALKDIGRTGFFDGWEKLAELAFEPGDVDGEDDDATAGQAAVAEEPDEEP